MHFSFSSWKLLLNISRYKMCICRQQYCGTNQMDWLTVHRWSAGHYFAIWWAVCFYHVHSTGYRTLVIHKRCKRSNLIAYQIVIEHAALYVLNDARSFSLYLSQVRWFIGILTCSIARNELTNDSCKDEAWTRNIAEWIFKHSKTVKTHLYEIDSTLFLFYETRFVVWFYKLHRCKRKKKSTLNLPHIRAADCRERKKKCSDTVFVERKINIHYRGWSKSESRISECRILLLLPMEWRLSFCDVCCCCSVFFPS